MAERKANFILQLVDRLTAPAKRAAQALRALETAEKATTAAAKAEEKAVAAVGQAAAQTARQVDKLANAQAKAARAAKAAAMGPAYRPSLAGRGFGPTFGPVAGGAHGPVFDRALAGRSHGMVGPVHLPHLAGAAQGFIGPVFDRSQAGFDGGFIGPRRATRGERFRSQLVGAGKGVAAWSQGVTQTNERMSELFANAASPLGMMKNGLVGIGRAAASVGASFFDAAVGAAKFALAAGVIAAGLFTKRIVELANFAQKSRVALSALSHSTAEGARQFEQARRIARELGADVEETTQHFIHLRAQQFSAGETETWIKLSHDLGALTQDAEAAERALRAVTQIRAKGKVQAEELMQLSEAGLNLGLVYGQLTKQTGKTREQIQSMMQKGELDAKTGVAAIQAAIMEKLGETKPGEYAAKILTKTLGGAFQALRAMPSQFLLDIAEGVDTDPLVEGMNEIKKAFSEAGIGQGVDFAQRMINLTGRLLPLVVDFGRGFADAFDGILDAMGDPDVRGLKAWAFGAGRGLANFFKHALKFAKDVVPKLAEGIANMDWDALGAQIKQIDWGKLAQDFVTLAGALAKIAAQLATMAGGTVSATQHAAKSNAELVKTGPDFGKSVGFAAALGAGTGALAGSFVPGLGTAIGFAAGGILGAGMGVYDYLVDAALAATAPAGELAAGAKIGSVAVTNQVTVTPPVGGDPNAYGEAIVRHLDDFAGRQLTEAVP